MSDTAPTIDERLSTAANTSNLTLSPNTRGPADLLIAAGRAPRVLGRHLIALYGEWDGQGKTRKPKPHAVQAIFETMPTHRTDRRGVKTLIPAAERIQMVDDWFSAERLRLFDRLRSLERVRTGLVAWATQAGIERPLDVVNDVLLWWLDHVCPACEGTKLEPLPIGGRGAIRPCKPCRASGERELPHGQGGRMLEAHISECVHKARQQIAALHWAHTSIAKD